MNRLGFITSVAAVALAPLAKLIPKEDKEWTDITIYRDGDLANHTKWDRRLTQVEIDRHFQSVWFGNGHHYAMVVRFNDESEHWTSAGRQPQYPTVGPSGATVDFLI